MNTNTTAKIMGGVFGLEEAYSPNPTLPSFLSGNNLLLANARSGIALLVELLSPPRVWLPSYLCGTIVTAVGKRAPTSFYDAGYDLKLSVDWCNAVGSGDLVILIDYFGFPCNVECIAAAKEKGALVLEDACQGLLTDGIGALADFVLYSPRKFIGVPDGGILAAGATFTLPSFRFEKPPEEWWLKAFSARLLRREFDLYGGRRGWFELYRETEDESPFGTYAMSELTEALLHRGFDYSVIGQRRIDNYRFLLDELGEYALFPKLPPNVVPLGFPIRINERDRIRQVFYDNDIYPPVHWPIQGIVPATFMDSHNLAADIMTLPCDQRYGRAEMERMVRAFLEALK